MKFIISNEQFVRMLTIVLVVMFTNAVVANDQLQNPVNRLRGTVARNAGGSLECDVTYNAVTGIYSGTLTNNHYSSSEWYSQELNSTEAQRYYQQLLRSTAED
jgi:hypothetical protein